MIKLKTWIKVLIAFSRRAWRFVIDFFLILFYLVYNLVIYRKPYDDNIIFVTAAEKNYFNQLKDLLCSYYKYLNNSLIIYDIGLERNQIQYLERDRIILVIST